MGLTKFGTWFAESAKFAATVLVWVWLKQYLPDQGPLGDVLGQVFVALVAGIITFAVLDVVLGRPLLRLVWTQDGKVIPNRRPDLGLPYGARRVLRVELEMEGASPVAMLAGRMVRKQGLKCVLTMRPRGTLRCVRQGGHDEAVLAGTVVTFDLVDGIGVGTLMHIEFAVTPKLQSTSVDRVQCDMEFKTTRGSKFLLQRLVRRDSGIDGFGIGGP